MHLTPKLHGLLLKCFCKGVNERVERYLMFVFNSTGSNPFFFLQLWLLRVVMIMSSTYKSDNCVLFEKTSGDKFFN